MSALERLGEKLCVGKERLLEILVKIQDARICINGVHLTLKASSSLNTVEILWSSWVGQQLLFKLLQSERR